jgi:hypothetical protein
MSKSSIRFLIFFLFFKNVIVSGQAFDVSYNVQGPNNVVYDVFELADSAYLGIESYANPTSPTADSLELFKTDLFGQKTKKRILKAANFGYSRVWRGVQVPDAPDGRIVFFSSKYNNLSGEKKAYVFCVDRDLNLLWEINTIDVQSTDYESFAKGIWHKDQIVLYGLFFNPSNSSERTFFWFLNKDGNVDSLKFVESMDGRWRGNESFLFTDKYVFFSNTGTKVFKCDLDSYHILDSVEIDLDTAFIRGASVLLGNGKFALLGSSDSVLSPMTSTLTGAATLLFFDEEGKYLSRYRKISNQSLKNVDSYINGIDRNEFGYIFLPAFEGINSSGDAKTDWLGLQCIREDQTLVWERYYRLGKRFNSYRTKVCSSGGVLLTGYVANNGERDGQIYKFDSLGNISGLVSAETPMTQDYEFVKAYPNPCKQFLQLQTTNQMVYQAELYTMEGKLITCEAINTPKGQLDMSDVPSGLYQLVLKEPNGLPFQKLSVIKE